ncbi:MAG: TonB-dependent receptor [Bacteroides sp.]|nr:TonB-dependent receptor [Bacteroides sp.]
MKRMNSAGIVTKLLFTLLVLVYTSLSYAQNITSVSGTVTDKSGEALIGATVAVKGTNRATVTNIDGNFELSPVKVGDIITVAYVGYTTQDIKLAAVGTKLDIVLEENISDLDELVVVGYGTQKKVNLTGSVSTISADELASRPVTNTSTAIAGLAPGISVIQNSGRPGAGASVKIRGTGTFSSAGNGPLVLIDGISGSMDDIDPSVIKSISILKDAASASIYGNRAANGVILIETQRGAEGKTRVTYHNNFGWQRANDLPDFLSSWEYATYYNIALENMGNSPAYSAEQIAKYRDGSDPDNYPDTNHLKWLLNSGSGFQQQHSVSVSGGSAKTRYNVSIGYRKQDGLTAKTNNERITANVSLDAELYKELKLQFVANAYSNKYNAPYGSGDIQSIIGYAVRETPVIAGKKSDGTFGYQDDYCPEGWLETKSFQTQVHRNISSSLQLVWDTPLKGLSLTGKLAAQYYTYADQTYKSTAVFSESKKISPANLDHWMGNTVYTDAEALANYKRTFGKNDLGILFGFSAEKTDSRSLWGGRNTFPNDALYELSAGDASTAGNSSGHDDYSLLSWFGRVNYTFDDRYLLEANARYDGSSRFAPGHRWGFFPSVSAGWRISEETFWTENRVSQTFSNLKLRISYGVLGNQNIGNYPYQQVYNLGYTYPLGNTSSLQPGAAIGTFNNEDISWEKTKVTDVGLDFGLFNQRLSGSIDYFYKYTSDILASLERSMIMGYGVGQSNVGAVSNQGVEINLTWNGNIGSDFHYSVSPNFTYVKNAVEKLANGAKEEINSGRIVGQPLGIIYGYRTNGLFVDQAEIDGAEDQIMSKSSLKPGYVRYRDLNGDGKVDADHDREVLGSTTPKFYYGLTVTAQYKGFDFSGLLQGVGGHKRLIGSYMAYAFYNGGQIQRWQADGCWTTANPDKRAVYPRLETANMNNSNFQTSDYWTRNASFLRLKNIQIGYTLPHELTRKIHINTLRIYVSGENLHTWNKFYSGWDPENEIGTGDAPNYYPIASTYSFGLNINF